MTRSFQSVPRARGWQVESLERRVLLVTPGTLDVTFDVDGRRTLDFSSGDIGLHDSPGEVVVQADGKLVAVGYGELDEDGPPHYFGQLARFNADGSLDATFGTGGRVRVSLPVATAVRFNAVALDGSRIVVAGDVIISNLRRAVVARFNANGSLDGTFGTGGVAISGDNDDLINFLDVTVDSFGRVVATGFGNANLVVARYEPDGDPDNSFDGNGKKGITFLDQSAGTSLAIAPDGDIVVCGNTAPGFALPGDAVLVRLNSDGSFEPTFVGGGAFRLDAPDLNSAMGQVAVQPNGRIVAAGSATVDEASRPALWRFNVDGTPDTTFGGDGLVQRGNVGGFFGLVVQTSGRIVVMEGDMTLHRYNSNGTVDAGFAQANFGAPAAAFAIAAAGVDKVVAFGDHFGPDNLDWALMRVHAGASSASSLIAGLVDDGDDTVYLRRNGNFVDVWVNRATTVAPNLQIPLLEFTDQIINTLGGNDTLTVDYSNGNTFPTTGGVVFEDGAGNDTLRWIGSTSGELIALSNNLLVIPGGDLIHTDPENIIIELTAGNDTLTIGDVASTTTLSADGGAGDDTFRHGGGDVASNVRGNVTLNGGAGNDLLLYDDGQDDQPANYAVNRTTLVRTFRGTTNTLTYDSMSLVELQASPVNNTITVQGLGDFVSTPLPRTLPVELLIDAGGGDDNVFVGAGDLNQLVGPVIVNGGPGADDLTVNDATHAAGESYSVSSTTVGRTEFGPLSYSGMESLALTAGAGNDTLVQSSGLIPVTLHGGGGNDAIHLGPTRGVTAILNAIDANVTVNGGVGNDTLDLNDHDNAAAHAYRMGPTSFDRTDFPLAIFLDVEAVELHAGGAANDVTVIPSETTAFVVHGNAPTAAPGDDLVLSAQGATGIARTTGAPGAGQYTFSNRRSVTYDGMETARVEAAVVGRYVFYNNSFFDGANPAANAADDAAIATDKQILRPGGAASFANVTSYARGINGVLLDVSPLPPDQQIGPADFLVRRGDGTNWTPAGVLPAVSVRRGAGASGSDRVTLVFPDGALRNTWVRITVLANERTGLTQQDVFFVGNLVGETGNAGGTPLRVNAADYLLTRANIAPAPATVENRFDFDRDGRVNAFDLAVARTAQGRTLPLPVSLAWTPLTVAALSNRLGPPRRAAAGLLAGPWLSQTYAIGGAAASPR